MEAEDQKIIERILKRLKEDKPVRMKLPCGGSISIDNPVPFLLIYRIPPDGEDQFTLQLGKTEASYIITKGSSPLAHKIINKISQELSDRFAAFMLLEVWVTDGAPTNDFTVHFSHEGAQSIAASLQSELDAIRIGRAHV